MPVTVQALRGATTVDADTREQINARVGELFTELYERNGLTNDDVISVLLTSTPDLRSTFAASAARAWGLDDVPLMGAQEAPVDGGLPRCIRVMLHITTERPRAALVHVYLEGAAALRPDLAGRPVPEPDTTA